MAVTQYALPLMVLLSGVSLAGCAEQNVETFPVADDRLAPPCDPMPPPRAVDAKTHALTNGLDRTWEFAVEYQQRLGPDSDDVCRVNVVRAVLSPGERMVLPFDDDWGGADWLRVHYSSTAMSTVLSWPHCWDVTMQRDSSFEDNKDAAC